MSAADPTIKERTQRLHASYKAKGWKRVSVWVPGDKSQELHRIAQELREGRLIRYCALCAYPFPEHLGKHGCPNCEMTPAANTGNLDGDDVGGPGLSLQEDPQSTPPS